MRMKLDNNERSISFNLRMSVVESLSRRDEQKRREYERGRERGRERDAREKRGLVECG